MFRKTSVLSIIFFIFLFSTSAFAERDSGAIHHFLLKTPIKDEFFSLPDPTSSPETISMNVFLVS
jgi:hypothetical protein